MQQNLAKFFEWIQKCSTRKACVEELNWLRWKNGFIYPKCGHDIFYQLKYRHVHECAKYDRQVFLTAGTVFVHTRLPLPKWLPNVHVVISNFKSFLEGTFHGISHRNHQEYFDEFVFRFNREFCEYQLLNRWLQAAVNHVPIRASLNSV